MNKMPKDILFSKDIRKKIKNGVEILNNSVRYTLGPKGRNVLIQTDYGAPLIINDGVSIAKSIDLVDPFEDMASKALVEAAIKTNDLVGDGTTSAILVASSLICDGISKIEQGVNPIELRNGLNYYLPIIVDEIKKKSKDISTDEDIYKVAFVSSGNINVANLIKEAYAKTSKEVVITLEDSQGLNTELVLVKGYSYDRGYLSSYLANGLKNVELSNPYVLLLDKKVSTMNELVPYLEYAMKESKPIHIICDDMENEVLSTLVVNKMRGILNVIVTKTPSFGNKKKQMLEDIAILTEAKIINEMNISSPNQTCLGVAKKIIVSGNQTVIITDENNKVNNRINDLKLELKDTTSEYDTKKIEERIAKLTCGVAIIKVGAQTEVEQKELRLLIEDAICATKAAVSSGIVQGGGKVFYEISNMLEFLDNNIYQDAKAILINALRKPFLQIIENAGKTFDELKPLLTNNNWFNASTLNVEDFSQMNIVDPMSLEVAVISNAVSISSVLLTTECGITKINKTKDEVNEDNLL